VLWGAHAFPGALKRSSGEDETVDVVQMGVADDETTGEEERMRGDRK
jgi:hypothetical protein